jgi:hypothetical protein
LYHKGVEAPIKTFAGVTYVRISVHVYNTLPHYQRLADTVMSLMAS